MNKKLILASLLATQTVTQLSAQERSVLVEAAINEAKKEIGQKFLSQQVFPSARWVEKLIDGEKEWVREEINVRLLISFRDAGEKSTDGVYADYRFDGEGELDLEVFIEEIEVESGEVVGATGSTFYAKKVGEKRYNIYNCDSTANCSADFNASKFYIYDTPEGRGLRLDPEDLFIGFGDGSSDIVFNEIN